MLPTTNTPRGIPVGQSTPDDENRKTAGSEHLARRSDLARVRAGHAQPSDILIIDDEPQEAERLTAILRVLFGYQIAIRCVRSLADAISSIGAQHPDLAFLDDPLQPAQAAAETIPALREAGYTGPIIVMAASLTPARRARTLAAGAADVIPKDDADSVRVAEGIDRTRRAD